MSALQAHGSWEARLGRILLQGMVCLVTLLSASAPGDATAPATEAPQRERRTAPPLPQAPVDLNHPPRIYLPRQIRHWTVQVEQQLADEAPDLARRALERLDRKLGEILAVLPAASHPRLQKLPLFLLYGTTSTNGGRDNGLEYFQNTAPQQHGYLDPRMASSIVIYSAENFVWLTEFWALKALVHEFAHGHHLEQWPELQPDIYRAWEHARDTGLYRQVKNDAGKVIEQGYALQNHLEYFAELSCMFFVGCNYEPFNRAALQTYDPDGCAMIRKRWQVEADDRER